MPQRLPARRRKGQKPLWIRSYDRPAQGGYRPEGHHVLLGDRPGEACERCRYQASVIDTPIFGNPPLGIQFLTSNPDAGLDWPVRLLVTQDAEGQVWAVHTDIGWIARRHHIKDPDGAFKMASKVIASITSSVASKWAGATHFASNFMRRGGPACDDKGGRRENSFASCVGKIVAGFLDFNHRSPREVSR
jgi:Domain of unknown function DUF302